MANQINNLHHHHRFFSRVFTTIPLICTLSVLPACAHNSAKGSNSAVPRIVRVPSTNSPQNQPVPLTEDLKQLASNLKAAYQHNGTPQERDTIHQEILSYVNEHPNDPAAWALLGHDHQYRGNDSDALYAYEKAHQLAPNMPSYQILMGRCLLKLQRTKEAAAQFRAALQSPSITDQVRAAACQELAELYIQLNQPAQAVEIAEEAESAIQDVNELYQAKQFTLSLLTQFARWDDAARKSSEIQSLWDNSPPGTIRNSEDYLIAILTPDPKTQYLVTRVHDPVRESRKSNRLDYWRVYGGKILPEGRMEENVIFSIGTSNVLRNPTPSIAISTPITPTPSTLSQYYGPEAVEQLKITLPQNVNKISIEEVTQIADRLARWSQEQQGGESGRKQ